MGSMKLKVTPDQLKGKAREIRKEIADIEADFQKID